MKQIILLFALLFLYSCKKDNTVYGFKIGGKATAVRTGTVPFWDNDSHWEAKTTTFPDHPVDSCDYCISMALLNGDGGHYGLRERLGFGNFPLVVQKHFLAPSGLVDGTRNRCGFSTMEGDIGTGLYTVTGRDTGDFIEITEINELLGRFSGRFQVTLLTKPSVLPPGYPPDTIWIREGEFTAAIPR